MDLRYKQRRHRRKKIKIVFETLVSIDYCKLTDRGVYSYQYRVSFFQEQSEENNIYLKTNQEQWILKVSKRFWSMGRLSCRLFSHAIAIFSIFGAKFVQRRKNSTVRRNFQTFLKNQFPRISFSISSSLFPYSSLSMSSTY